MISQIVIANRTNKNLFHTNYILFSVTFKPSLNTSKLKSMKQQIAKTHLWIISVLGWFALISQFYLIMLNRIVSIPETIIRYFSFFTLLTNILVALCSTILLLIPLSRWGKFFSNRKTLTAITVYIVIVGFVYNLILRFLWKPEGLQQVVDELLHTLIPILFLLYWIASVPKSELKWKDVLVWLLYPLIYVLYILLRGAMSGFYPYPFINVIDLGYNNVAINICLIASAFLFLSLLLVAIAKSLTKVSSKKTS